MQISIYMTESSKSITRRCVIIQPGKVIKHINLSIDYNLDQPFIQVQDKLSFQVIAANMKQKYNCCYYRTNVAQAVFPNNTYYSIFYESNNKASRKLINIIATQIINHTDVYDSNDLVCYGNCYIVHFDSFYDLYDVDVRAFGDAYNIKHTKNGPVSRTVGKFPLYNSLNKKVNNPRRRRSNQNRCILL